MSINIHEYFIVENYFSFSVKLEVSSVMSRKALPESVGFEGGVGVDVVMQPPLHRHVPVTHAVSHLHAEVRVVAVNVLDGFEVIFLFNSWVRTGHTGQDIQRSKINTDFQQ